MLNVLSDLYAVLSAIGRILPTILKLLRAIIDREDGHGNGAEAAGKQLSIPVGATAADYASLSQLLRDLPRSTRIDMVHLLDLLNDSPGLARFVSLAMQFALDEADPDERQDFHLVEPHDQADDEPQPVAPEFQPADPT